MFGRLAAPSHQNHFTDRFEKKGKTFRPFKKKTQPRTNAEASEAAASGIAVSEGTKLFEFAQLFHGAAYRFFSGTEGGVFSPQFCIKGPTKSEDMPEVILKKIFS